MKSRLQSRVALGPALSPTKSDYAELAQEPPPLRDREDPHALEAGLLQPEQRACAEFEEPQLESTGNRASASNHTSSSREETSGPPRRTICICADDFGLHAGINQAAIILAREHRISAISCLVDGPEWQAGWNALKANAASIEVGLHLNFTADLGQNVNVYPLSALVLLAYAHVLSRTALRSHIQRQFERFEATTGRMPDFVDGHQHVHQLPMIRNALVHVLNKRYSGRKPWLRAAYPPAYNADLNLPMSVRFKSKLAGQLGAAALSRLARKHGYDQNLHLLGIYGFDMSEAHYLHNLQAWLTSAKSGDVLMCHPSLTGPWNDPLLGTRYHEYRVLSGDAYTTLTEYAGIQIGALPFRVS